MMLIHCIFCVNKRAVAAFPLPLPHKRVRWEGGPWGYWGLYGAGQFAAFFWNRAR